MSCLHSLVHYLAAAISTNHIFYTTTSVSSCSAASRPPTTPYGRPAPPRDLPIINFGQKLQEKISFRNVPNWEQPETSRESVISKTEMSDEDPSRSPTPPVGPPEAMPPILSFAEKQEVSTRPLASIHIPTSRPHFTSTLQCPCPLGIHA